MEKREHVLLKENTLSEWFSDERSDAKQLIKTADYHLNLPKTLSNKIQQLIKRCNEKIQHIQQWSYKYYRYQDELRRRLPPGLVEQIERYVSEYFQMKESFRSYKRKLGKLLGQVNIENAQKILPDVDLIEENIETLVSGMNRISQELLKHYEEKGLSQYGV